MRNCPILLFLVVIDLFEFSCYVAIDAVLKWISFFDVFFVNNDGVFSAVLTLK